MLNKRDHNSFSDLFSVCKDSGHTASLKIRVPKVQDLVNFELSPIYISYTGLSSYLSCVNALCP